MTPVSTASIIGMIFTLLISLIVPIAACIVLVLKWRKKVRISSFFIGACTFILFAMILERIFHTLIFRATGTLITGNVWLYALYGGLAAGLFEETGRLVAMKYVMKDTLSRENAILYGVGHGGIEAMLIIGLTYINNLLYSLLINSGALPNLLSAYDADTQQTLVQQLSVLGSLPSQQFYLAGIERIGAMLFHIVLSYLIYLTVRKNNLRLYVLSIFLHAFLNAGVVILSRTVSVLLSEIIMLLAVVLLAAALYQHEKTNRKAS